MKSFQQNLEKIQPKLSGHSIIDVSGPESFQYSSSGVDDNSQFYIGSVSKHMTAYMLLLSLQKEWPSENLDDLLKIPLRTLFPKSKFLETINADWINQINLLELLTHQSGLSDYLDAFGDGSSVPEILNKPVNPVKLLQSISFNPKKHEHYSNSNYLILGKLIEEMNGNTFDKVFLRLIREPAKMTSSFAPASGNYFKLREKRIFSKLTPNMNEKVFIDMSNALGAGNIISSISDLKKWADYLFNKAPKNITNLMIKNHGVDADGDIMNLGLGTMQTAFGPFVGHQGDIDSFSSFFGLFPNNGALVIILSNNSKDANKLMEAMTNWLEESPQSALIFEHEKILHAWNKQLTIENSMHDYLDRNEQDNSKNISSGYGPSAMVVYKS